MKNWLKTQKYQAHLLAFVLMILASIGLIFTVGSENPATTGVLLGVFVAGNLLALAVQ